MSLRRPRTEPGTVEVLDMPACCSQRGVKQEIADLSVECQLPGKVVINVGNLCDISMQNHLQQACQPHLWHMGGTSGRASADSQG